jgi:hypothetical protein
MVREKIIDKWIQIYHSEDLCMTSLIDSEDADELSVDEKRFLLKITGDDDCAKITDSGELVIDEY